MHCTFPTLIRGTPLFNVHRTVSSSIQIPIRRNLCSAKALNKHEAELIRLRKENKELRQKIKELKSNLASVEDSVKQPQSPRVIPCKTGIRWGTPNESPPFWTRSSRFDIDVISIEDQNGSIVMKDELDQKCLYVMHITAEMAPIAKVGGLADVVTGLSRASLARGHTVEVCLPYYQCLSANEIQSLEKDCEFDCPFGSFYDGQFTLTSLRTQIWKGKIAGVPVFLIRPDWSQSNLFKADRIYGGGYNETEAYLYFSRACLEFLRITDRHPNILHLHEWQTAAVALLYWEKCDHDPTVVQSVM